MKIWKEGIFKTDLPCAIFNAILDADGEMMTAVADMEIHHSVPWSHFEKFKA